MADFNIPNPFANVFDIVTTAKQRRDQTTLQLIQKQIEQERKRREEQRQKALAQSLAAEAGLSEEVKKQIKTPAEVVDYATGIARVKSPQETATFAGQALEQLGFKGKVTPYVERSTLNTVINTLAQMNINQLRARIRSFVQSRPKSQLPSVLVGIAKPLQAQMIKYTIPPTSDITFASTAFGQITIPNGYIVRAWELDLNNGNDLQEFNKLATEAARNVPGVPAAKMMEILRPYTKSERLRAINTIKATWFDVGATVLNDPDAFRAWMAIAPSLGIENDELTATLSAYGELQQKLGINNLNETITQQENSDELSDELEEEQ